MTAAHTGDERTRIGQIIRHRRAELNLTQDAVVELGGPSTGTQRSIENGHAERYRPKTLRSIDEALRWRPGTAAKLVSGNLVALESAEAPVPLDDHDHAETPIPPAAAIDMLVWAVRSASVADLRRLRDVVDTALAIRTEEG